ncbi:MAG TPA: c-type cytochrome [Gemmataceae bacterium]|nr:c-type cytochrome [Gemmataceae bacterium]
MKSRSWINAVLLVALLATAGLCWFVKERDVSQPNYEFWPESQMAAPVAYDSFAPNPNFADGLTLRRPPSGSIARGQVPFHYEPTLQDAIRAGLELQNPFTDKDTARRDRGGAVFADYCQVCHGPLGQGNGPITQRGFPPPASLLADRALQMKDGQMFHVLTYGQGNMPGFSTQLARDDRWSVILHVRMLQEPYTPSNAGTRSQQIAKVFRDNCAACHGEDGTGNNVRKVLPVIPDFTSLAWQMSQTEMAIVNQIDYGTNPWMPSFRYKLPTEQILSLAVYVRSFAAHAPGTQAPASAASHITANNVYGTFCFACHDTTGKGNPTIRTSMPELPDFTTTPWQKSRSDADLVHSILEGKGKFMLPMKDKLGSVDVKQMVALVRAFEGGKQVVALEAPKAPGPPAPVVVTPPSNLLALPGPQLPKIEQPLVAAPGETAARIRVGAGIFQQYCIVCHGPDGTGSIMRPSMPPIPDFTSRAFHEKRSNAELIVSILDGKGTLMPANRGRVTEEQAGDLAAYVRAFGPKLFTAQVRTSDAEFEKKFQQLQQQWNELEKELKKTEAQK